LRREHSSMTAIHDVSTQDEATRRTVALARHAIPRGGCALVVTRGDETLLDLGESIGLHFPQNDDGTWLGYHLATGDEVVAQIEVLRDRGARYFVLPSWALWWLSYYEELQAYLESSSRLLAFDEVGGLVYQLDPPDPGESRLSVTPVLPASQVAKMERAKDASPAGDRKLTTTGVELCLPVNDEGAFLLTGSIAGTETPSPRAALVAVEFSDREGQVVPGPYPHLSLSARDDIGWYHYIATTAGRSLHPFVLLLEPPARAASVRLRFRGWDRALAGSLYLTEQPELVPITAEELLDRGAGSDGDEIGWLRMLSRLQVSEGRLTDHVTSLQRLALLTGTDGARKAVRRASGMLRELDPAWLPELPGRSDAPVDGGAIRPCHLFKVVYPFESSGGAIRNLNVVRSQRALGLDPYVITPLGYPATHGHDDPGTEQVIDGVRHIHLPLAGDDPALPPDRRTMLDTIATAAAVRRAGADLIHAASGFRGYELALKGLALARHFAVPLVYEVRSLHEHLWGSPRDRHKLTREWTLLRIAQENRCMLGADAVVTISHAMRDVLIERGVPDHKITIVPNAVDLDAFPITAPDLSLKAELGLPRDAPVVGYISNVSHREGHDVLLRAFAEVAGRRDDVRCLIVGDGPELRSLERLASSLGVRDRVVFTGEVDHAKIRAFYSIIDVFVVPRRPDYAADHVTPLKPFEALALERAMIVSDLPSLREIVGREERGLCFRPEDSGDLARKIGALLDAPSLRRSLGEAGRRWIATERTWDQNAIRYKALYEELLADARGDLPRGSSR
jgi:glycosyltransferase involved in cell wall biosynthesis